MFIPTDRVLRRVLKLSIAGTRGGFVRLRILLLLSEKPLNINELATRLSMDYTSIQHHIRVLQKAGLIQSPGKKYRNAYALSAALRDNRQILDELSNIGKTK